MKKGLIITLYDNNNYGNRLQNFALQNILSKYINVETYNNVHKDEETKKIRRQYVMEYNFKLKMKVILSILRNKISFEKKDIKELKRKRVNKFINFSSKNVKTTENKDGYDYYIIGSDQVWNPAFARSYIINFGLFAKQDSKVISYAASFGINQIPEACKSIYRKGLNNISNISVREEVGAEIVKDLVGKEALVVVDPTMLLTAEEWRKIAVKPKNIDGKKYILTYFLGKISDKRKEFLEKVAKENNLEIINMIQITESETYIAGPSEFLSYIDNASIVFTDSFHACVFSILFKIPFYILRREDHTENMNSRLDTLLSKFKLEDRKLNSYEDKVLFDLDYSHTDEILEEERKKSDQFLRKALNIGD